MALDHKDIDLLMEGLESIEKAHAAGEALAGVMGSMITGMATNGDTKAMEDYEQKRERERMKKAAERRRKQEDVFLLRAKLVGIRRELDGEVAERIVNEAASR